MTITPPYRLVHPGIPQTAADQAGMFLDQSGDMVMAAPVFDLGGAVFNVKHPKFGATGDGVADDTTAIQAAIDLAALGTNGGTVALPQGIYRTTTTLNLKKDVTLIGMVQIQWSSISHGATIKAAHTGDVLLFDPGTVGSPVNVRIGIANLFIDADNQARDGIHFIDFSVVSCRQVIVARTTRHGFHFDSVSGGVISFGADVEYCYVNNATTAGYMVDARFVHLRACICDGGQFNLDATALGSLGEIIGCHFETATTAGVRLTDSAQWRIGSNLITDPSNASTAILITGASAKFNTVVGNALSRDSAAGSFGIRVTNGPNNVIVANTIADVQIGVRLESEHNSVQGNVIDATATSVQETGGGGRNVILGNVYVSGDEDLNNTFTQAWGNQGSTSGGVIAAEDKVAVATLAALVAGDTNNYNTADVWAHTLRVSGSGGGSTITGILAPSSHSGARKRIINISAISVTLSHQDTNSAAANRLLSPTGASVVLGQDDVGDVEYDETTQRWRIVNVLQ